MTALIFSSILTYACTDGAKQKQAETQETTQDGSVIVMNKDMFILASRMKRVLCPEVMIYVRGI
mgnify:CR=1 FL=1